MIRQSLFVVSCFGVGLSLAAVSVQVERRDAESALVSNEPLPTAPSIPEVEAPAAMDPRVCDEGAIAPERVLSQIAWDLSRQHIGYNSQDLSDCSGILHRLLEGLRDRCDGSFAPQPTEARSSRELAAWYQSQGLLVATPDLSDADRWLVPGAVTFYTSPDRRSVENVVHTAVVVDVERDEQGRVLGVTLFHGRQPGKVASFTSTHRRDNAQPLGNGKHALFALAYPHPAIARNAPGLADGLADSAERWEPGY